VCRNFDIAAMEARGIAAARVQGITSFEETLSTTIESCTAQAKALGVINEIRQASLSKVSLRSP